MLDKANERYNRVGNSHYLADLLVSNCFTSLSFLSSLSFSRYMHSRIATTVMMT